MTETGLRQWMVALGLSLCTHLGVGIWLERMPPIAPKITVTSLTVSLATQASGGKAVTSIENKSAPAHTLSKASAALSSFPKREMPAKASSRQTPAKTEDQTTTQRRTLTPARRREEPAPTSPAVHESSLVQQPAQALQKPVPDLQSKQSPSEAVVASKAKPSALDPAQVVSPASRHANGALADAGSGASAATPAPGNPKPHYPSVARRRGYQGRVLFRVALRPDGRPKQIEIKESSGHRVLDDAALDAIREWRFLPARRHGHAVSSMVEVPISFRLEKSQRYF